MKQEGFVKFSVAGVQYYNCIPAKVCGTWPFIVGQEVFASLAATCVEARQGSPRVYVRFGSREIILSDRPGNIVYCVIRPCPPGVSPHVQAFAEAAAIMDEFAQACES